jgi:hypothetical protein
MSSPARVTFALADTLSPRTWHARGESVALGYASRAGEGMKM